MSAAFLARMWLAGMDLSDSAAKEKIHLVAGLALEIDGELAEDSVHRGDTAEAPALVRAIAALGEGDEGINVFAADFPCDG